MIKIKCGITGHTGSIGKQILKEGSSFQFKFFKGDITKKKDVKKWIKNSEFEYLIHLAAVVPIKEVNSNKIKAFKVNTLGTENLVDAILVNNNKVRWVFFASTSHVYSSSRKKISEKSRIDPISYYGKTKYYAEKN